jgi:hypothetical protein
MMIQVFSEYYNLAQEGRVKPLSCPMHKEDPDLIFQLVHKEENDKIVLYCLACSYKIVVGQQLYDNVVSKIKEIQNGL